ncbi:MAG: winged helix-turn-helix transcriptional regulator [Leptospira sp.]|nr:winged helix-turn-helix transcriptional regulator [Leptospira sp.]
MTTKTDINYEESEIQLANFSKALSHPARIRIVRFLLHRKTCFAGDISKVIPLGNSTISEHLRILKSAQIIQGEVEAPHIRYCICKENKKRIDKFLKILEL